MKRIKKIRAVKLIHRFFISNLPLLSILFERSVQFAGNLLPVTHGSWTSSIKINLYKCIGISISNPVFIDSGFQCINPRNIKIGNHVSLGHDNHIWAFLPVKIGHHTITARDLLIISASHDVSTFEPISGQEVEIGPGCWIGARVTILGGVKIGKGCVIGAGSLIRESIPDWSVAVGVPARAIRKREAANMIWNQFGWYSRKELERQGDD